MRHLLISTECADCCIVPIWLSANIKCIGGVIRHIERIGEDVVGNDPAIDEGGGCSDWLAEAT